MLCLAWSGQGGTKHVGELLQGYCRLMGHGMEHLVHDAEQVHAGGLSWYLALIEFGGVDIDGWEHVLEQHAGQLQMLVTTEATENHKRRCQKRRLWAAWPCLRSLNVPCQRVALDLQDGCGALQH